MTNKLLQQALELLEVVDQPEGYVPDFYDTIKAIRTYLVAQAGTAVQPAPVPAPPGWELVPVEPTPEMCISGDAARHSVVTQARTAVIYRAMIAASPEVPAPPGWELIKTAPKDGTAVLLGGGTWGDDFRDERSCVMVGWWEVCRNSAFWNTCAAEAGYSMFEYASPTHWMPLPPPPSITTSPEQKP